MQINSMTRVMQHDLAGNGRDIGTAQDYFSVTLDRVVVGEPQGADSDRGADEWWPLTVAGQRVGELRDDASGLTIHVNA